MRNAFADEVTALGRDNARVVMLSADIGNKLFDKFKAATPGRFLNCGIAEANMMGMAAGMALNGLRPIVYTIAPFTTTRCLEQIRLDVCYHRAPVIIVGTGSGLSYAELGPTHLSCEDMAILRVLPDMVVMCPADSNELRLGMRAALAQDKPVYLRIGKKGEPAVHPHLPDFQIGKAITVRKGSDVCLIGTGTMVSVLLEAAKILVEQGVSAQVESFHTVKPLDSARLSEIFAAYPTIVVAEEHSRIGGFGSAIAEWMADNGRTVSRFLPFGVGDEFVHEVGSQDYMRQRFGLTANAIANRILGR